MQAVQSEEDLDAQILEVKVLLGMVGSASWNLAQRLIQLDVSGLWKTRKTVDGKVAYKSFDAFIQAELGMSRRWWQDLVQIASRFSEEEYRTIGPSKLRLVVMHDDPVARDEILKSLKGGASRREIERDFMGWTPGRRKIRAHFRGGPYHWDLDEFRERISRTPGKQLNALSRAIYDENQRRTPKKVG